MAQPISQARLRRARSASEFLNLISELLTSNLQNHGRQQVGQPYGDTDLIDRLKAEPNSHCGPIAGEDRMRTQLPFNAV